MRFDRRDPETALLEDGSLEIRFRPRFSRTLRVTPWADGLRVFNDEDGRWVEMDRDPQFAFVASALRAPDSGAVHAFARAIRADAVRLANACGTFELTAFRMLRWHDAAWDLTRTSPNLAWLLAARVDDQCVAHDALAAVLRKRRVDVVSWCLATQATPATLRLLEKIEPDVQAEGEIRLIARTLAEPEVVRLFRHLARVPLHAVRSALAYPQFRTRKFFVDALTHDATADGEPGGGSLVSDVFLLHRDALRAATELRIPAADAQRQLDGARSIAALRARHDAWSEELMDRLRRQTEAEMLAVGIGVFPSPPVADSSDILALRTVHELAREGSEMRHCVAGYARECAAGRCFVFRVLAPTRATLEIRMNGGRPYVAQIRGARNELAPQETWTAVQRWLEDAANPGQSAPRVD